MIHITKLILILFFSFPSFVFSQSVIENERTSAFEEERRSSYIYDLKKLINKSRQNIDRVNDKIKEQAVRKRNQQREDKARGYYERADELFAEGKFKEARQLFEKAINITEHPEMQRYIRESEKRFKVQESAMRKQTMDQLREEEEQRRMRLREVEQYYSSGISLFKQKKYHEAQAEFRLVDEVFPDYKATRSYLRIVEQEIIEQDSVNLVQQKKEVAQQVKEAELARLREKELWREAIERKEQERKLQLQRQAEEVYEEAIAYYDQRKFLSAKEKFQEVEWVVPDFKKTRHFLKRIDDDIKKEEERLTREREKELERQRWEEELARRKAEEERERQLLLKEKERLAQLQEEAQFVYDAAIELFNRDLYAQAKEKFHEVEDLIADFKSTQNYIERCAKYIREEQARIELERQREIERKRMEEEIALRKAEEEKQRIFLKRMEDLYIAGLSLYREEKYEDALVKFEAIEKERPNYKSVERYTLAAQRKIKEEIELREREATKARQEEEIRRIEQRLAEADLLYKTAVDFLNQRLYEQAKEKFVELEDHTPNYKATRAYLDTIDNEIELERKRILAERAYEKEQQRLAKELEIQREEQLRQEKLRQETEVLYQRGVADYKIGNFADAKAIFLDVTSRINGYKGVDRYLSRIDTDMQRQAQQFAQEERLAWRKIELDKLKGATKEAGQIYKQALELYKQKQYQHARVYFERVDELVPQFKRSHEYLARIDERLSDQPDILMEAHARDQKRAQRVHEERERQQVFQLYTEAIGYFRAHLYEQAQIRFAKVKSQVSDYRNVDSYLKQLEGKNLDNNVSLEVLAEHYDKKVKSAESLVELTAFEKLNKKHQNKKRKEKLAKLKAKQDKNLKKKNEAKKLKEKQKTKKKKVKKRKKKKQKAKKKSVKKEVAKKSSKKDSKKEMSKSSKEKKPKLFKSNIIVSKLDDEQLAPSKDVVEYEIERIREIAAQAAAITELVEKMSSTAEPVSTGVRRVERTIKGLEKRQEKILRNIKSKMQRKEREAQRQVKIEKAHREAQARKEHAEKERERITEQKRLEKELLAKERKEREIKLAYEREKKSQKLIKKKQDDAKKAIVDEVVTEEEEILVKQNQERDQKVKKLYRRALRAHREKKLDKAQTLFKEILSLVPDYKKTKYLLGNLEFTAKENQFKKAQKDDEKRLNALAKQANQINQEILTLSLGGEYDLITQKFTDVRKLLADMKVIKQEMQYRQEDWDEYVAIRRPVNVKEKKAAKEIVKIQKERLERKKEKQEKRKQKQKKVDQEVRKKKLLAKQAKEEARKKKKERKLRADMLLKERQKQEKERLSQIKEDRKKVLKSHKSKDYDEKNPFGYTDILAKARARKAKKIKDEQDQKEREEKERLRKEKEEVEQKAEEARLAKIAEEKKRKEEERLAKIEEEKRKEQERLAKIEEERKRKEEKRLAKIEEEKRKEQERLAKIEEEKKRKEQERLAKIEEEKRKEQERLAKIEEERKRKEEKRLAKIEEEKRKKQAKLDRIKEKEKRRKQERLARIKAKERREQEKQEKIERKKMLKEEAAKRKEQERLEKIEEKKRQEQKKMLRLEREKKLIKDQARKEFEEEQRKQNVLAKAKRLKNKRKESEDFAKFENEQRTKRKRLIEIEKEKKKKVKTLAQKKEARLKRDQMREEESQKRKEKREQERLAKLEKRKKRELEEQKRKELAQERKEKKLKEREQERLAKQKEIEKKRKEEELAREKERQQKEEEKKRLQEQKRLAKLDAQKAREEEVAKQRRLKEKQAHEERMARLKEKEERMRRAEEARLERLRIKEQQKRMIKERKMREAQEKKRRQKYAKYERLISQTASTSLSTASVSSINKDWTEPHSEIEDRRKEQLERERVRQERRVQKEQEKQHRREMREKQKAQRKAEKEKQRMLKAKAKRQQAREDQEALEYEEQVQEYEVEIGSYRDRMRSEYKDLEYEFEQGVNQILQEGYQLYKIGSYEAALFKFNEVNTLISGFKDVRSWIKKTQKALQSGKPSKVMNKKYKKKVKKKYKPDSPRDYKKEIQKYKKRDRLDVLRNIPDPSADHSSKDRGDVVDEMLDLYDAQASY